MVPACMCRPIIEFSQAVYIMDPGFHLVLAGYQPAWAMWYIALISQALVPCLIYTHAPSGLRPPGLCIYQAKHSSLWYKYNIYSFSASWISVDNLWLHGNKIVASNGYSLLVKLWQQIWFFTCTCVITNFAYLSEKRIAILHGLTWLWRHIFAKYRVKRYGWIGRMMLLFLEKA